MSSGVRLGSEHNLMTAVGPNDIVNAYEMAAQMDDGTTLTQNIERFARRTKFEQAFRFRQRVQEPRNA